MRAGYLAISYHTLKGIFPDVLVFPGERVRFFASPTPGLLVRDPKILTERLAQRGLRLRYVRSYYLLDRPVHAPARNMCADSWRSRPPESTPT